MAKKKYAKYVMEPKPPPGVWVPQHDGKVANPFTFEKSTFAGSAIHCECHIHYAPGGSFGGGEELKTEPGVTAPTKVLMPHKHDVDEVFFFVGTNPQDTSDLGGEYEFWLGEGEEAEKYTFTKTTCIYVPKGLVHNPNIARRVDRPFLMFAVLLASEHSCEYPACGLPPGFKR